MEFLVRDATFVLKNSLYTLHIIYSNYREGPKTLAKVEATGLQTENLNPLG